MELSKCEEQILKLLFDAGHDLSTQEIIKCYKEKYGKDWARTTVVTFTERMCTKGYITKYRKGKESYCHAEWTKEDYISNKVYNLTGMWFSENISALVEFIEKMKG